MNTLAIHSARSKQIARRELAADIQVKLLVDIRTTETGHIFPAGTIGRTLSQYQRDDVTGWLVQFGRDHVVTCPDYCNLIKPVGGAS